MKLKPLRPFDVALLKDIVALIVFSRMNPSNSLLLAMQSVIVTFCEYWFAAPLKWKPWPK